MKLENRCLKIIKWMFGRHGLSVKKTNFLTFRIDNNYASKDVYSAWVWPVIRLKKFIKPKKAWRMSNWSSIQADLFFSRVMVSTFCSDVCSYRDKNTMKRQWESLTQSVSNYANRNMCTLWLLLSLNTWVFCRIA